MQNPLIWEMKYAKFEGKYNIRPDMMAVVDRDKYFIIANTLQGILGKRGGFVRFPAEVDKIH